MADIRNDHEQIVDRILKSTDYFSVLGLKNTCSEKELAKAFRNLAKKVHPDKNETPLAHKAFIVLQEAYDTLKDPKKRRSYVQSSKLHSTSQRSTRQRTQFTFTRETDENNADPFRQRTQFTSSRKANENKDSTAEKDWVLIITICVWIAVIWYFLIQPSMSGKTQEQSGLSISKTFELQKTDTFNVKMITKKLKIPFYVERGYRPKSGEELLDLWETVEKEFSQNDDHNLLSASFPFFNLLLICLLFVVVFYASRRLLVYFFHLF